MAGSPEGGLGEKLKNAVVQRVIGTVVLVITAVIVGGVKWGLGSLTGQNAEPTEASAPADPNVDAEEAEVTPPVDAVAHAQPNVAPLAGANLNAPTPNAAPAAKLASTSSNAAPVVTSVQPDAKRAAMPAHLDAHLTYQYNALGRRDPFTALVGGDFVGADVGGDAPPDPGGMKVVGIVWGATDQFALVEDARGNSFVLRKGDKVQNGYIESLKRDAVLVTVTADGQSQTVSIPLERKGDSNAR